jgi:flagellar operon protein
VITTIDLIPGRSGVAPADRPEPTTQPPGRAPGSQSGDLGGFAEELAAAGRERSLHLSGHALRRLEQRQIDLGDEQLDRLQRAMDTLASKGGRQSLVMLDQVAYVVHVPSHTVVTAVAPDDSKESVFTQIDSVVIA